MSGACPVRHGWIRSIRVEYIICHCHRVCSKQQRSAAVWSVCRGTSKGFNERYRRLVVVRGCATLRNLGGKVNRALHVTAAMSTSLLHDTNPKYSLTI